MVIHHDIDLYKYSTMRLHSICETMYVPHNVEELCDTINTLVKEGKDYYLVAAGSNIVFSEKVVTPLINLMELDDTITYLGDNRVRVGCSVRIQKLINSNKEYKLGGIEYLYSVPTSVGGATYMNAGRGKRYGLAIADYIEDVEYLDVNDMKVKTHYGKEGYSYRHSPFQDMNVVILSTTFRFKDQSSEETAKLVSERLAHSQKYLSADKPSCGTVFCQCNPLIMRLLRGRKYGGAMYSKKTSDWISNMGNATASDIKKLIDIAIKMHKFFRLSYKLEVRFYK